MPPQAPSHQWTFDYLNSPIDQSRIRYGVYKSKSLEPRRYIVFLNGRTEWIEKYNQLPIWLDLPAGYGFLTWDHRGQGASEGPAAHVENYDHFAADTAALIQHIVGDRQYGIVAHSMGGLISLYSTLKDYITPSFLVLSSPLLLLPNEPIKRAIAKPLSEILSRSPLRFCHTGVSSINQPIFHGNTLTHSYQGFDHIVRSRYTSLSPTIGWVNASFMASEYVNNISNLRRLNCPTLIICGSHEQVVDYFGFSQWVLKARKHANVAVELNKIPLAKHEILNEIPRYRNQAVAKIINWAKSSHFFNVKAVNQESMSG